MTNLQRSVISLSTGANLIIVHNLHWHNVAVDNALQLWINKRSKAFITHEPEEKLAKDLCLYIRSQNDKYLALTEGEYEEFKNRNNAKQSK